MHSIKHTLITLSLLLITTPVFADSVETQTDSINPACPDAQVFSDKLISAIDWNNVFPIRIAGAKLGDGDIPDGAAPDKYICACLDNNGVPYVGTQISMWRPTRLIEVVRVANCSPAMGGKLLQSETRLIGGPKSMEHDSSDLNFYNVNVWAFPLITMLELFSSYQCNPDGYMDIDLINLSTVDPTWNDDELSILFTPEAFIFATPSALALQIADAVSSAAGKPLNRAIGSAGAWGNLYPLSGYNLSIGSPTMNSSLIATKALAKLHRIGFARRTMGEDVMCETKITPTLTKSQYKMSMFFPVPEIEGKLSDLFSGLSFGDKSTDVDLIEDKELAGFHVIGSPTFLWGEWRNRPATGEDHLYVVWSWVDCCGTKEGM